VIAWIEPPCSLVLSREPICVQVRDEEGYGWETTTTGIASVDTAKYQRDDEILKKQLISVLLDGKRLVKILEYVPDQQSLLLRRLLLSSPA